VRDPDGDRAYPRDLLHPGDTALILFAAGFHGRQDAWHIADKGLTGTCVDTDGALLAEMQTVYPEDWSWHEEDVFSFANFAALEGHMWDVVSLDPFTNLFDRCADLLPTWCTIARKAVVLGSGTYTVVDPPDGWRVSDQRWRSDFHGGIYWRVLEPA
jgi:hypothetical protein